MPANTEHRPGLVAGTAAMLLALALIGWASDGAAETPACTGEAGRTGTPFGRAILACRGDRHTDCWPILHLYLTERHTPEPLDASGPRLLRTTCKADQARGCDLLALALAKGLNDTPDRARDRHWHRRSCDRGVADACEALGDRR